MIMKTYLIIYEPVECTQSSVARFFVFCFFFLLECCLHSYHFSSWFQVDRGSNGGTECSAKAIEIPPPRPKRKPMHPYPRKSVDVVEGIRALNQLERSLSPNLSVSEKENQSPTSVLSAIASDTLGSEGSEQHNGCSSPTSCTTDVHSVSLLPIEKENEHLTSNSSAEEKKGSSSSVQISSGPMPAKFLSMVTSAILSKFNLVSLIYL